MSREPNDGVAGPPRQIDYAKAIQECKLRIEAAQAEMEALRRAWYAKLKDETGWTVGDLVRYGDGETALAVIISPHGGGWHAEQCMGGVRFIHDGYPGYMSQPSDADYKTWHISAKWRAK